jgi:hypothetical protein
VALIVAGTVAFAAPDLADLLVDRLRASLVRAR